jgi:hypothetical protein
MAKYKSMQGREVDMDKLMTQNELMPAIGNARVNARGDELGPGGKIIKKREEIMAEYYENNPKAVPSPVAQVDIKPQQVPPSIVGHGTNSKKPKVSNEE